MASLAAVHVLLMGSLDPVAGTCSLIVDGDALIVVDPGLAPTQAAITDPLLGYDTAVILQTTRSDLPSVA